MRVERSSSSPNALPHERATADNASHQWVEQLAGRIRSGDIGALSRAISAVENRSVRASTLLQHLFPFTGRALMVGVTGTPGAGKSTLLDQLARALRQEGQTVGIIAIDPSSPFSGGALLGDRVRMMGHYNDPSVFIRSMATRGALGGVAAATLDVALLIDAAGRDVVLIETVGTGQDEVDVMRLTDVTVLVLMPGLGDEIQASKAGLLEIADVFAINKADRPGVDQLESELKSVLSLSQNPDGSAPRIVRTIATEGQGVNELLANVRASYASGDKNVTDVWAQRLAEMWRESLIIRFPVPVLSEAAANVAAHRRDPYSVIREWSERYGFKDLPETGGDAGNAGRD